jgi:hypothetical protein
LAHFRHCSNRSIESQSGNAGARQEDQQDDEKRTHEEADVQRSLKIHIKLNLDVDMRIIAKIKGDIAVSIL